MSSRVGLLVVGIILTVSGVAWASELPMTVSPGRADGGAVIESRCPTFSWGEVEGARSYELVVYRLGDEGEEAQPVLRESFVGAVDSWTPSLDLCLERGAQYAWSVRAVGSKEASEWSAPSLFQVASGPSAAEFEEALRAVRAYIAERHGTTVEVSDQIEDRSQRWNRPRTDANPPSPAAPAVTALSVEGNVDATSFTGDGTHLAGIATDAQLVLVSDELCRLYQQTEQGPMPAGCGNTVFLTTDTYDGDLGGLSGADAKCNQLAAAAGLSGTFKAWLSDDTCGPADRCRGFQHSTEGYFLVSGARVADNWDDLVDGILQNSIDVHETGAPDTSPFNLTWTGTDTLGEPTSANCSEWTSGTSAHSGTYGIPGSTDSEWTDSALSSTCAGVLNPRHLYCFEQ